MQNNVISLALNEAPLVRCDAIRVLQDSLGVETSRDVVERAVFEISDRLCRLELALFDSNHKEVEKLSSSLVGMSTQIGLVVFADVAAGLALSIRAEDFIASAALATRLLRLGETSLFCAVELADLSG